MTVEELVLLIDLLDKLGYNTETAGTGTVFQRLAQIADYVDTLEAKLGLNTDAAGTSTVFARLAQIAGYTDQVEGYVDALESNLGTTGDAANPGGTVLARLAELLANRLTVARAAKLDKIFDFGSLTPTFALLKTSSTNLTTVVNVTGSGLAVVQIQSNDNTDRNARGKITADGVVIADNTDAVLAPSKSSASRVFGFGGGEDTAIGSWGKWSTGNILSQMVGLPWIAFNSSFLFEVAGDGTNTIRGMAVVLA